MEKRQTNTTGLHHQHVPEWDVNNFTQCTRQVPHRARLKSGTNLSRGSRRGRGGGAGAVLQGEVGDEDDELGKCTADLSTRALKQVLREAVGVREQNVVCKPIAYILTVS